MPTMTALMKVAKGPGHVELREVDVPIPGPEEVLVEVHHVGICGSDLHITRDTHPNHPPVILGHEFSGTIATLGDAVKGWQLGDRVVSELHGGACGQCRLCKTGDVFACPHKRPIGWWTNGAYADYIRVPARLLHRVPGTELLGLLHPAQATAVHRRADCVRAVPDYHVDCAGLEAARGVHHVLQQRLAPQRVQDFRRTGAHARPLAGSQNDYFQSHSEIPLLLPAQATSGAAALYCQTASMLTRGKMETTGLFRQW